MNNRCFQRSAILTGVVGLLLAGACGLWAQAKQRQNALNRQLIAALVKRDTQSALVLVNAGADPNTPFKPFPPPSRRQLWNYLIHRTPLPINNSPTAFLVACGAFWSVGDSTAQTGPVAPQLVQAMIRKGAYLHAKDEYGWEALEDATKDGHPETVRLLLTQGAPVNARDHQGITPLLIAGYYTVPAETVRLLLDHGADVNVRDDRGGNTPLIAAASYGAPVAAVRLLLERGADVNARDQDGGTALIGAAIAEAKERNTQMDGASSADPDVIGLLLKYGADVNARDKDGMTPLVAAADFDNYDRSLNPASRKILLRLLAHGANPNQPATNGKTLLQLAQQNHCSDLVALLHRAGAKK